MASRTPRKSNQAMSGHKIIVGIDYGTTFTGASYVSTTGSDIKDVIVIGTWPGPSRDSETVFKAPSRIAYPLDNPLNRTIRWGFQVEPGMTTYSWTKLLLDRNTALGEFDDPTLEGASKTGILQLPCGKSAVGVVGDFLKEVRTHILKMIEKQITKEVLGITPIEYWFTVPAIWSDQAKAQTKTAAQRAGFAYNIERPNDQIFMVTEPEAAAIAALNKTATDGLGASFKPGDGVLVCDCGGGTVDITTYLINKVEPLLSFEELCTGIGGKCGSTAIDRNLYRLMSRRFGKAFDMLPAKKKGPGSEFMRKFEIVKKDFGFNIEEDKIYELPLNIRAGKVKSEYFDDEERLVLLSSNDIRQLFDPVVDQVIGLVRKQMDDAEDAESGIINRIILVGGFGDSEYLREKMEKAFFGITITVPDNPQTAIVKGAALRGLWGLQVTTKRCRRHYGFKWSIPFRQGIDREKHAYIDEFTRKKMVGGIMKWMISKGEKYTENHTHTVDYTQVYHSGSSMKIKFVLFSSDSNEAPERVEHTSIKKVGTISVDITDIDFNLFEKKLIDGVLSYQAKFSVKVIFGAQDGVLKFETTSQGKVVGKTIIDFTNTKYY
ncbi:Actin-like ATPase domain-containing protein [Trichophyton interdigitale]|uniref:Actin-like ATPase domain-containing protein n=1 Tax=Trichophyton interdigitale TaxID=101480 RepID=A0A9P5CWE4_9EURO|nr:Actin-like ATPase domain-containing protein [Trichophyton interdigitale]KAF3894163.1 Actin-like ATPase domain-containing protein [Trichophyton interdigitale]KAG8208288.1 Actin-like ATPase domain-containing protein [Trichophyton interdigitale]